MEEMKILSQPFPGYGFPRDSIERGFKMKPDILVSQGTSTDMGPSYLGTGKAFVGKIALKRDLRILIETAYKNDVTFIGSLSGPGSNLDLDRSLEIINEIAHENKMTFEAAVIPGEIDKEWLIKTLKKGAITKRLAPHPSLPEKITISEVMRAKRVVSQMGPEPIMKALDTGVKFIFTGRALDIGLIAASPLREGFYPGLTYHMAKLLECGALSASPPAGSDAQFAILRKDYFLVLPPNPSRKCTPISCASHSFYERPDPHKEENPGGFLDVTGAKYEQWDDRTVKVTGSRWVDAPYTIKLEGVSLSGYRTICIGGIRCPALISKIDMVIPAVKRFVEDQLSEGNIAKGDYKISFRVYGKNGVMSSWEPETEITSHELCIVIDIMAQTQDLANDVCALARSTLLHWGFPERKATAGNLALPFSPSDIPLGELYDFNIFHSIEIKDPNEPFPYKILRFPYR